MISPNGMDLNAWQPKPSGRPGRTRNAGGITGPYDGTRRAAGGAIIPGTNPGRAQSQQNPYAGATTYGQPPSNTPNAGQMPPSRSQPSAGGQPYQAYSPANQQAPSQPAQAPAFQQQMPSFQFTGGTDWMGNQYTDPNAMMAQTGAMAQALNQQRQGMLGQGQFGPLNPQMAYNQGMEMLQQGWQNPFAAPPAFPQFQDPGNNIRDLIQGPQQSSRYGLGLTDGARIPMDMRDADGDGVVDYYQSGPGMPDARMAGGKPDPTPRLPAGLYRPENILADRGPDWHTTYYNPSTGETFQSYKNTVRPEEGSGWVSQGRERLQQGGQQAFPGQAQPVQDPYGSSAPYRINDYDPMRSDYGINERMYRPWTDKYGVARDPKNGERDSDLDGVVDQSPPAGPAPVRPTNRPPPTAEEFRQQQAEIKQKEAVNDLYRRANLQPGASTDELMLGLINNSRGGTLVRPEALAGLPADIRGAVSQYQDLAGMAQGLDRSTAPGAQQRRQDIGAALEQMKSRMTERAQTSQALQRDYGMSADDAAAWVNREMPMPDQAATMQGLQQKQSAYEAQERAAALTRRDKELATQPRRPDSFTDAEARAWQQKWANQMKRTSNPNTNWMNFVGSLDQAKQALAAEDARRRGLQAPGSKGETVTSPGGQQWSRSGSPIADRGRAMNALRGAGFTGIR